MSVENWIWTYKQFINVLMEIYLVLQIMWRDILQYY